MNEWNITKLIERGNKMTHSQDIAEIKKEFDAFTDAFYKKHKEFLDDIGVGIELDDISITMHDAMLSAEESEAEETPSDFDQHNTMNHAMQGTMR